MESNIKNLIALRRSEIERELLVLQKRIEEIENREEELTPADVRGMSEDEIYHAFRRVRWPHTCGSPVCPFCNCDAVYSFKARKIFKCKLCEKQFSITSGTVLSNRKAAIRSYLLAMILHSKGGGSLSAASLSRGLGIDYKSAFMMSKKLKGIEFSLPPELKN